MLQLPEIYSYIITMVRACVYAAVWVSNFIYFITWYAIVWRDGETSYGYSNTLKNTSTWASISDNKTWANRCFYMTMQM